MHRKLKEKFLLKDKKNVVKSFAAMLLLFFMGVTSANAQQKTITGLVQDVANEPLLGVNIFVKGTNKAAISDFDGNYSIKAKKNDVLVFESLGFVTQELKVFGSNKIDVKLKESSTALEEVVVIGYGTQKKKEVTGAVVQVKSEVLEQTTTSDIGSAIQGQIAGVNVTAASGEPGQASNIVIRGYGSLLDGQSSPLYVVDGIPYDSDPQLSISEIETIDVLKDAASASIYGTRGSNGVILITTKQGKVGEMSIRVNTEYGVQKIISDAHALSKEELIYVELLRQTETSKKTPISGTDNAGVFRNSSFFTNNTDLAEIILDDLAPIQNHSFNVSGGKKDLRYSFNANFYDQKGILVNSGYQRFNVRANTKFTKGKWDVTTGLTFRRDERVVPNNANNVMNKIYDYRPYQRPIDLNSNEIRDVSEVDDLESFELNSARDIANAARSFQINEVRNGNNSTGNIQVDFNATKDLKISGRAGAQFGSIKSERISPRIDAYNTQGDLIQSNQFTENRTSFQNTSKITGEVFANYKKDFDKHNIALTIGTSYERSEAESVRVAVRDNQNQAITVLNNYATIWDVQSDFNNNDGIRVLLGNIGRVQYNYDGKYLFSASGRLDGSSQFTSDNRWAFFPSMSLGWNVSDEAFWEPMKSVVNSFKIRGSYGSTGNDRFRLYSNQQTVSRGLDYAFGSSSSANLNSNQEVARGVTQTNFANTKLKWETNIESNIGYDLALFKNKLTISMDAYRNEKRDLLYPVNNPLSLGVGDENINRSTIFNVGNMVNSGVEYAVGYKHNNAKNKFSWNVSGTYTKNINRVTKTSESNPIIFLNNSHISSRRGPSAEDVRVITEGHEAAAFFLRQTDGVIKTEEELAIYKENVDASAKLGQLRYIDQNKDGRIDTEDRVYSGSGTPDYEIGLNFSAKLKGFDLAMQLYGAFGGKILNGSKAYAYQSGVHRDLYYAWSQFNTTSDIPKFEGPQSQSYRGASDYFLEDGDYIRLRNISLGYSLPKKLIEKMGMTKLRFYIQAQNPITFTKYTGLDPEVGNNGLSTRGIDAGRYPTSSQYKAGLQFQF